MFSRYRRLVSAGHRKLISEQQLRRPNWFVGAAEQPLMPRDPALSGEIDAIKARIDARLGDAAGKKPDTAIQEERPTAAPGRAASG